MKKLLFLSLIFCTTSVFAADITARTSLATELQVIGEGVRVKYAYWTDWNIYEATLYGSNIELFSRSTDGTEALDSLLKMPTFGIRLKLLRAVDGTTLATSFEEALKINDAADSDTLNTFKNILKKRTKIPAQECVIIQFENDEHRKVITLKQSGIDDVQINADEKDFRAIMSIWLGVPVDDKMAELKAKLIQG
jgi:hypothetical protein